MPLLNTEEMRRRRLNRDKKTGLTVRQEEVEEAEIKQVAAVESEGACLRSCMHSVFWSFKRNQFPPNQFS
jgi:hypothetical protein